MIPLGTLEDYPDQHDPEPSDGGVVYVGNENLVIYVAYARSCDSKLEAFRPSKTGCRENLARLLHECNIVTVDQKYGGSLVAEMSYRFHFRIDALRFEIYPR